MTHISELHLEHARNLFLSERSRRESMRASLSTPVAAISFAVFALSSLSVQMDVEHWRQWSALTLILLETAAVLALFTSAYQVVMSEWLFVYHDPPRVPDLLDHAEEDGEADAEARIRGLLVASYAVAYEQYLRGNTDSARRRTWALRLILLSLLIQAVAFLILPFHRAGW
ncbi:hypothetical protein [Sphingosinicella rhizophila]|uniref:Uncharacterized protein n=1 Tax=Sphingosinicella rhizophila TaxID=3050082 RepID=A0ABU3QA20_9SPHN|nr:hypothetical protein [Sphingosinicella sp. GR2756]MDT9600239.1 hypothetical protein [Sphingosinicella sp. GR2756]